MVSSSRQNFLGFLPAGAPLSSSGASPSSAEPPGAEPAACRPRPRAPWTGPSERRADASGPGSCWSSIPCPPGTSAAGLVATLLDPRCLAAQFPEVVQLGAAHPAPADRLDPLDR